MSSNTGGLGFGIALFILGLLVEGINGVIFVVTGLVFIFVLLLVEGCGK